MSTCPFHADNSTARPGTPGPMRPTRPWPPGPAAGLTGWSLIRDLWQDPLGKLREWQQHHGDLIHLRIWPEHEIIVADPVLARQLLVQHHDDLIQWERAVSVFRTIDGVSVFTTGGERWKRKRQALQPAFAAQSVLDFVPALVNATAAALAHWPREQTVWPVEQALTSLGMEVIVRMIFSAPLDFPAPDLETAVRTLMEAANREMYFPFSAPAWVPWKGRKRAALACLDRLVNHHIDQRLRQGFATWPDDLLSRLLRLHLSDPAEWSREDIRDECRTAFLAGHETLSATLSWWAWSMASHPEAQEKARAEVDATLAGQVPQKTDLGRLDYLQQTLAETQRLYPAAPLLVARRSVKPLTLGAYTLPARTLFLIPLHLFHQDARWFPHPETFQPERFSGESRWPKGAFVPFGEGPRVCLGQHLAQTELKVITAMLLQRYRFTPAAAEPTPQPRLRVSLRPATPLKLQLTPR
ncbi:MAG: cytochrome P450 [Zoogloea sp.]|uniref:cytochrome P450 n=1 Tax=Zoogloea sp. TaxID=49181 RepID=UPI003F2AFA45